MNEQGRNEADISRYTDVEYSPEGYKTVYRWGDFLEIAGGHVHNAMDTIDLVLAGGEYEGFNPRYAYTCEFVGCSTLIDGIALFRPVSRDGEDLTQIAFLRSDIDDDTGAYTERFEAGSFDIAAASDIQCSDLGIDLLDYFRGRSFEGLSGVKRGLDGREAVVAVEVATGCDLDLFEDFWLGSPGETDVHVGPYVKRDLIALSYIVNEFSQMHGTTARDIRKLLAWVNNFHPDRLAAVKAYLDREAIGRYVTNKKKVLVRGKSCGHEWQASPTHLLNGSGCPVCAGRHQGIVVCLETGVEYKNYNQAAHAVGLTGSAGVKDSCMNPNRTAGGFHWWLKDY